MPAATFAGRTFLFTPEDLLVPGILCFVIYLPCCVILADLMILFHDNSAKIEGFVEPFTLLQGQGGGEYVDDLQMYRTTNRLIAELGWTLVGMFGANALVNAAMSVFCCRGSMLESKKRAAAMPLLMGSILLCFAMLVPLGVLTYTTNMGVESYKVEQEFEDLLRELLDYLGDRSHQMQTIVVFAWLVIISTPVILVLFFNLQGRRQRTQLWLQRCGILCGCTDVLESSEAGECAIKEELDSSIERIFGVLPLIGSDFPAGVMLLSALQKHKRHVQLAGKGSEEQVGANLQGMLTPPSLPDDLADSLAQPLERPLQGSDRATVQLISQASYHLPWAEMAYGTTKVVKPRDTQDAVGDRKTPMKALMSRSESMMESMKEAQREKEAIVELSWAIFNVQKRIQKKAAPVPGETQVDVAVQARRELIREHLGVASGDILSVRMENQALGCVPYFIALDRERKSVVLSIRGSASLEDALTDLINTAAPIEYVTRGKGLFDEISPRTNPVTAAELINLGNNVIDGFDWNQSQSHIPWQELEAQGGYGHRGIIAAAAKLWDDIRRQGVLAAAVSGQLPGEPELASWGVTVTGHSLGGGLAALMTWALKPALGSDRLCCWAFEPPGCLVSPNVADELAECCISVIHAKDLVPRLTWSAISRLEDEMMEAVAQSKINKNALWWSRLYSKFPWKSRVYQFSSLFHDEVPVGSEAADALAAFRKTVTEQDMKASTKNSYVYGLPGKILYLRPLKCSKDVDHAGARERLYDAVWITREQLAEDGILLSQRAVSDHDFIRINEALSSSLHRAVESNPAEKPAAHITIES